MVYFLGELLLLKYFLQLVLIVNFIQRMLLFLLLLLESLLQKNLVLRIGGLHKSFSLIVQVEEWQGIKQRIDLKEGSCTEYSPTNKGSSDNPAA